MITHVSIGVRDIDRSKRFYDATLEPLGYKCLRAARSLSGYGYGRDSIALWVVQAERPVPADEKSGRTFVLPLRTPPPSTRFTRRRLPQGGATMVRPVYVRFTPPTTTPPSSSIQTDTGSKHITVQSKPEVSYHHRPGNLRWPG